MLRALSKKVSSPSQILFCKNVDNTTLLSDFCYAVQAPLVSLRTSRQLASAGDEVRFHCRVAEPRSADTLVAWSRDDGSRLPDNSVVDGDTLLVGELHSDLCVKCKAHNVAGSSQQSACVQITGKAASNGVPHPTLLS